MTKRKKGVVYMLLSNVKSQIVLAAILCAAGARADMIGVTVTGATYSAPCVGGTGTCTEVINGSFILDTSTITASSILLSMTGSLTAALDSFGTPFVCLQGGCTSPPLFWDSGANPAIAPIEWNPTLD